MKLIGVIFAAAILLGSAVAAIAQELRLGAGDTLSFGIVGVPETRQQAQIGFNGRLFFPYVGSVQAEGLTLDQIRQAVNGMLRSSPIRLAGEGGEGVLHGVQANEILIDVVSYRPVYISGDVRTVGPVVFRPGMTVRQAVAEAGGLRVFDDSTDTRALELIFRRNLFLNQIETTRQTIFRLESDLRQIDPELSPDGGTETGGDPYSEETGLTEAGEAWLETRSAMRTRVEDEQHGKLAKMRERLDVLRELRTVNEEVVQIREDELARARDLVGWGRATTPEVDAAREGLLQASSRSLDTADELFRVEIELARDLSAREIDDLGERLDLLERIDAEETRLLELQRQVRSLDGYIGTLGISVPVARESSITMKLVRTSPHTPFEGPVEPDVRVMPGDVIEVRWDGSSDVDTGTQ
ncbi:polysaccharide biosynthesis/export family protein [Amaricoccus tamworthensis]|uniref:polysaccharide biosynthesis/export family protein n=1 Tax=Amaricoccus tamworthensis TaxID=57002 RepID=UPI003C7CD819